VDLLGSPLVSGELPALLHLSPGDGEWGPYYSVRLGEDDVPPLRVEVNGDWVRLSWEYTQGAPMDFRDGFRDEMREAPSGYLFYSLKVETQRLPDLVGATY
jgi:hypothetical protein